ncbi:MAG TPA: CDP-alcohol phosphatidyltransferase family protein [Polyangiaceae bacterium]
MDGSIPSSDAFARAHKLAPITDEVSKKLRGGVWERSELARSAYSSVLELGRWLSRQGITPNALTYVALLFAVGSGVAAATGAYLTSALLLLVSSVFDLLDGIVARSADMSTRFGALLDSTVDRLADALPLLGMAVACAETPLAAAVLMSAIVTGFAVSYVRARAEGLGIKLPTLFMRRAERIALLLAALLVGSISVPGFPSEVAMLSIVAVMAALSLVAAVWAMRAAYVALSRDELGRGVSVPAATPSRP